MSEVSKSAEKFKENSIQQYTVYSSSVRGRLFLEKQQRAEIISKLKVTNVKVQMSFRERAEDVGCMYVWSSHIAEYGSTG